MMRYITYECIYVAILLTQIVNGYLHLLSQVNGKCKTIISQMMTSIVNCVAAAQRFHLLSKVYIDMCILKNYSAY